MMASLLCWAGAARGQGLPDRLRSSDAQTREAARQAFLQADEATQRAAVLTLMIQPADRADRALDTLGGPAVDRYLIETVTDETSFFAARRALFTTLQP